MYKLTEKEKAILLEYSKNLGLYVNNNSEISNSNVVFIDNYLFINSNMCIKIQNLIDIIENGFQNIEFHFLNINTITGDCVVTPHNDYELKYIYEGSVIRFRNRNIYTHTLVSAYMYLRRPNYRVSAKTYLGNVYGEEALGRLNATYSKMPNNVIGDGGLKTIVNILYLKPIFYIKEGYFIHESHLEQLLSEAHIYVFLSRGIAELSQHNEPNLDYNKHHKGSLICIGCGFIITEDFVKKLIGIRDKEEYSGFKVISSS